MTDYKDTELYSRYFKSVVGQPYHDHVTRLAGSFEQFRRHVEPLASEISQSVPGYTDHSIKHCDALWEICSAITGSNFPLNPAEVFILGGAFLIHDLGMGLAAYAEGLPGIIASESWKDLLWARSPENAEVIQASLERDVMLDPTWNGISSPDAKLLLTTFLRESHAKQAEKVLSRQWKLSNGESFFLLADSELRLYYGDLIGKIGRSHWLNVDDLAANLPSELGSLAGFPTSWSVNPLKLACALRLADAAQVDAERASPLHTPFRQPQHESKAHWLFQERILHPVLHQDRLTYTSAGSFGPDKADAWWLAFDTVQMIDRELRAVDALCADTGLPRFTARGVSGAEAPARFAKYVPPDGWQPIDARPRISDPPYVIGALGGTALYGGDATVALREILANACDATRARTFAHIGGVKSQAIEVRFKESDDGDSISVRDFGIGMSAEDLAQYLCGFGISGWRSQRLRDEYPGVMKNGYSSTGQYGIGFFSAFMVADRVIVRSRPFHGGWNDTSILIFEDGPRGRPTLRSAVNDERLDQPGTEVTMQLTDKMFDEFGIIGPHRGHLGLKSQMHLVRRIAMMADQEILVHMSDGTKFGGIGASVWKELEPDELLESLSAENGYSRSASRVNLRVRKTFKDALTPVHNSQHVVVGRLAFKPEQGGLPAAAAYCDGFYARELTGFAGLITGKPVRAARDRVSFDVTLESMNTWSRSQWKQIDRSVVAVRDQLELQNITNSFGVVDPEAPICITAQGMLNAQEFRAWCASHESFALHASYTWFVLVSDGSSPSIFRPTDGDLVDIPDGLVVVPYGRRSFADGLPLKEPDVVLEWPENREAGETFIPAVWWESCYMDLEGLVVEIAARSWRSSLDQTILAMNLVESADPAIKACLTASASEEAYPVLTVNKP